MTLPLRPLWRLRKAVCWRLARAEAPPLAELADPEALPVLMAFLEATVGLVEAPEWADRPFRSPNPSGSRFSDGSFGVLYAGLDLDTCLAEMTHHLAVDLRHTGAPAMRLHFLTLRMRASGDFLDVRHGHDRLHRPNSLGQSRLFGIKAWRAGADGLAYRSVRRPGGECLAVFRRPCVDACARAGLLALDWDGAQVRGSGS